MPVTTRIDLLRVRVADFARSVMRKATLVISALALLILTIAAVSPAYARTSTTLNAAGQPVTVAHPASAVETTMATVGMLPASHPKEPGGGGGFEACNQDSQYSSSDYLAVTRWGDATGNMHARQSANAWDDITQKVSRYGIDTTFLNFGNTAFSTGTNWVEMADQFCPANTMGAKFDKIGGGLAKSIWDSGLIAVIFILGLGWFIWNMRRHPDWRWLIRSLVILGVFATMMTAAAQSDPDTGQVAKMSPGWIINGINQSVGGITTTISANQLSSDAINKSVRSLADPDDHQSGNKASCLNFLDQLGKEYTSTSGGVGGSVVPRQMDSMWQMTGLPAYVNTQFGKNSNYGWQSFCWPLERQAGVSPNDTVEITSKMGLPNPAIYSDKGDAWWNKSVFWAPISNTDYDESGIFGAQCQYKGGQWAISPGFDKTNNSDADNTSDDNGGKDMGDLTTKDAYKQCVDEWNGQEGKSFKNQKWSDYAWNWQDGTSNIAKGTANVTGTQIKDGWNPANFLGAFHGNSGASDSMSAVVFMVVALILMVVFGGLALMVFLMKLVLVFMGIVAFFILLAEILPGREGSHLGKFFKQLLGFSVLAFGFSLLLGLVMSGTSAIVSAGPLLGLTGLSMTLWTGFAPLLALFAFSWAWKHFASAPNPLSPKGMLSYARSAGSVGNATANGLSGLGSRGTSLAGAAATGAAFGWGRRHAGGGAGAGGRGDASVGGPGVGGGTGEAANRSGGMGDDIGKDGTLGPDAAMAGAGVGAGGARSLAAVKDKYGADSAGRTMRKQGKEEFRKAFNADRRVFSGDGRMARMANAASNSHFAARRRAAWEHLKAHPSQGTKGALAGGAHRGTRAAGVIGAGALAGGAALALSPVLAPAALAAGGAAGAVALAQRVRHRDGRVARRAARDQKYMDMFRAAAHTHRAGSQPAASMAPDVASNDVSVKDNVVDQSNTAFDQSSDPQGANEPVSVQAPSLEKQPQPVPVGAPSEQGANAPSQVSQPTGGAPAPADAAQAPNVTPPAQGPAVPSGNAPASGPVAPAVAPPAGGAPQQAPRPSVAPSTGGGSTALPRPAQGPNVTPPAGGNAPQQQAPRPAQAPAAPQRPAPRHAAPQPNVTPAQPQQADKPAVQPAKNNPFVTREPDTGHTSGEAHEPNLKGD